MIKRIALLIIILALSVACSFSATFYASTAGSNTAPYDTLAKGATSIQTALNAMNADGDILIIDDETWVISTPLDTNSFTSAPANNSALTIKSLSDDPTLCILSGDQVSGTLIDFNQAVRILDITLSGVGLTKSVTHTDVPTAAVASTSGQEGDITFDNCKFYDIDVTYAAATGGLGPIVRCAGPERLISFVDCDFDSIAVVANGGGTCSVLIGSGANPNLLLSGCSFTNITFNQAGVGSIGIGWVYAKNAITVTDLTLNNLTSTKQVGATGTQRPFIYAESTTDDLIIDGAVVTNLTWSNGTASGAFAMAQGPYDVKNIHVSFCSVIEPTSNALSCAFYAWGNSATGTFSDSVVHDCVSPLGPAFYAGQGGGGTVTNLVAYNNTAVGRVGIEQGSGGAVYCGGWGDVTINNSLIFNNTGDEGGAIYAHVHTTLAQRSKTTTVNNCVLFGNVATGDKGGAGGNGALFRANNATYTHTVNVINTISFNGGVDELYGDVFGGDLIFTVDHSDVDGGAAAVTGEDTYTNNINADPLFLDTARADFHLNGGSPCLDAGVDVGLPVDFDGEPVVIPFIGAYGFGYDLARVLSIGNSQDLSNFVELRP